MQRRVAILGASTRAMTQSAVRAGYRVVACDLFGDDDLRQIADRVFVVTQDRYPFGFLDFASELAGGPWCYTGGLENHPGLIERLRRVSPLWGNDAQVGQRVRDPDVLANTLTRAGLPFPRVWPTGMDPPSQGRWLIKSHRGTGGAHVRDWRGEPVPSGCYLQEFIEGDRASAVYSADTQTAVLLGATRQILASDIDPAASSPFQYVGSVGPLPIEPVPQSQLVHLGTVIATEFSLRGVFGVDFVQTADAIWPIEVNPRYPASAEVIERATGTNIFACHAAVFGGERLSIESVETRAISECVAKLIVFAPHDGRLKHPAPCHGPCRRDSLQFADVPKTGTLVRAGWPVLTIFREDLSFESAIDGMGATAKSFLADWFEKVASTDG